MWGIYAQASKTLVYLGDDSSDSGIAMGFIAADYKNLSSTRESRPSVGPKSGGPISSHQTAFGNMLWRPWFESVWVLQEVHFAPEIEVLCGDKSFDPRLIAECLEDLNRTGINRKAFAGIEQVTIDTTDLNSLLGHIWFLPVCKKCYVIYQSGVIGDPNFYLLTLCSLTPRVLTPCSSIERYIYLLQVLSPLFTIIILYHFFRIKVTLPSPYLEPHNSKMSSMWDPQRGPVSCRNPLSPKRETTISALDKSSAQEAVYRCDCGKPEASEKWICCDGDDCPVKWYHWECVQVTDKPTGDWFCPKCHDSQEKRRLLDQPRKTKTSVLPNLGKTAAARSTGTGNRKNKGGNAVADKGHVRVKKGTAIKKPTPKKTRRIEWVEITSEDEDEDEEERVERETAIQDTKRKARTKAQTTPPNKTLTFSHRRQASSKRASKQTKHPGIQPENSNEPVSRPPAQFEPARSTPAKVSMAGVAKPATPIVVPQAPHSQPAVGVRVRFGYGKSNGGES